MTLAQRLYEAGYITYMRTDLPSVGDAVGSAGFIERRYGSLSPESPIFIVAGRPELTKPLALGRSGEGVFLSRGKWCQRLYDLIWRRLWRAR